MSPGTLSINAPQPENLRTTLTVCLTIQVLLCLFLPLLQLLLIALLRQVGSFCNPLRAPVVPPAIKVNSGLAMSFIKLSSMYKPNIIVRAATGAISGMAQALAGNRRISRRSGIEIAMVIEAKPTRPYLPKMTIQKLSGMTFTGPSLVLTI